MNDLWQRTGGTGFEEVDRLRFEEDLSIVPSRRSTEARSTRAAFLYESIANALECGGLLEPVRNTFLPEFLTGELTVSGAEKLVADPL